MEEKIEKDTLSNVFKAIRKSFGLAWKHEKVLLGINISIAVLVGGISYFQLASFSKIVDEIIRIQQSGLGITRELWRQSIILGILFIIPAFLNNLFERYEEALRVRTTTHNQFTLISSLASIDIGTIQSTEFQSKLDKTTKWGLGSINNVIWYTNNILRNATGLLVAGIMLYLINPLLVLLAILGSVSYYIVENKYGKELWEFWMGNDDSRIEQDRVQYFKDQKKLVETILFNLKEHLLQQISVITSFNDKKQIAVARKKSIAEILANIIQTVCLLVAIVLVAYATLRGQLLIGSLLLAFTSYQGFVGTTQNFFQNFSRLQEQSRFANNWFAIFEIKSRITSSEHALQPVFEKPPRIEFVNVSFRYPETDKQVLKQLNLTIESGEKLAIVGENGAGKTTLIKLLCRIYDPTEGEILVDGVNLKDIDLDVWRAYMGILLQDFTNYQMTVREAIAIARSEYPVDDEKVIHAAMLAGADEFIQTLPKKYDQLLWKGFQDGVELSKGQFQRLAIARIFYRDALISVLDEPTSAIDAVAEEKIFEVLETKMEGKTVVLISHRFSTVKNADKIAVVEHGEIKELGSHKDLMKKNGRYRELYSMQASRYLENEE